jgi:hypothetical protein
MIADNHLWHTGFEWRKTVLEKDLLFLPSTFSASDDDLNLRYEGVDAYVKPKKGAKLYLVTSVPSSVSVLNL